jgi:hypothetical protein
MAAPRKAGVITEKTIGPFVGYAVASVIAPLIPVAVLSAIPFVVFVLPGLILPLMWAAPVLVLAYAVKKRSTGGTLGALCGLPLLFAYFEVALWLEAERIEALDQRSILPPQQEHRVLVIEDSYSSILEGTESCNEICLQILFDGRYVPVVAGSDGKVWRVFQLAHGQTCVASPRATRYLELLGRRYADVCISASDANPQSDALVIREHFSARDCHVRKELPCRSSIREYFERVDNQDRLLSRWVTSYIETSGPWGVLWGFRKRTVGLPFQNEEFYAAVLGMPIQRHLPRDSAPLHEILSELRPIFDDPKMVNWAMNVFERAMGQATPEEAEQARQFLQARIIDLKASPDPDPKRIEWFENWLKRH